MILEIFQDYLFIYIYGISHTSSSNKNLKIQLNDTQSWFIKLLSAYYIKILWGLWQDE